MSKVKSFRVFSDPGHSWVKVPIELVKSMGIADKITRYSYINKNYVFLEEDCDLTTFINKWNELHGEGTIKFVESWTNRQSKIRNYQSYRFTV